MGDAQKEARPTMAQVALLAGVSKPTVSRVLSGSANVASATKARVLDAIAELGYQPDVLARALRNGRTDDFAVVVPFVTHPSAVSRLRGIVDGLRGTGRRLTLFDIEDPGDVEAQLESVMTRRPAGVVVISIPLTETQVDRFDQMGIPLLLIETASIRKGVASVNVDDVTAGELATRHLLGLGHRRIGFVGDEEGTRFGFVSSARRRLGYQAAHQAAGIDVDFALVRTAPHERESARAAAIELLGIPDRPTAFLAASDTQALGIIDGVTDLGLSVPDDVSVVGCDDVDSSEDLRLTTVSVGLYESGVVGAHKLSRLIDEPDVPVDQVLLPVALKERATVAVPRDASGAH